MPCCAIITCKNRSTTTNYRNKGVTYHGFPSDGKTKEKWIEAAGRAAVWWPSRTSTICSLHFTEDLFEPLPKSRRLFASAVPTLRLPVKPKDPSPSPKREVDPLLLPGETEIKQEPTECSDPANPITNMTLNKEMGDVKLNEKLLHKTRLLLLKYKEALKLKTRKIKTLQKKVGRYKKKVAQLDDVVKELRDKYEGNSGQVEQLSNLRSTPKTDNNRKTPKPKRIKKHVEGESDSHPKDSIQSYLTSFS